MKVAVSFPPERGAGPLDGRLLVMLANNDRAEPRHQIDDGLGTQLVFGLDVEGMRPHEQVIVGDSAFGYPIRSLSAVPAGDYFVQALLHRYETFHLATGHTVKLPPDRGEGQQWNEKPGNLLCAPVKISFDPAGDGVVSLVMDRELPAVTPPADTRYVRHLTIRSDLLSAFWGRPVHLGAHVLVPEGFDEHPEARYPIMIYHGHFSADFAGFSTEPPAPDMDTSDYSERFRIHGYEKIKKQEAFDFHKQWTSEGFPRFLVVEIQHANPYYDDSYAVNSANLGPYGDAIMRELLPEIERRFRGIGEPWARFAYGGSTGGWAALAAQIFYPDELNGCFAACPDPVDFRAFTLIDIYRQKNAYHYDAPFKRVPIPSHRDRDGQIQATMESTNHFELALGTRSRSGQQYDIWDAVFSPQGEDGYPRRLFDKLTGEIDPEVAAHWREHYDLRHILERDWKTLGPKLAGKIHVYCGEMDSYYLNNAVVLLEDFLRSTTDPPYAGQVDYGRRAEHCWNGDHGQPNHISRLRYHTMYLPHILKRMADTAPPGADLTSWRY